MSTDHHLEDNADDQRRGYDLHDSRRDVRELEQLRAAAALQPTPPEVRTRHQSAIDGATAGRDIAAGEYFTDLVGPQPDPAEIEESDRRHRVVRIAAERIPAGARIEVRSDGRVYPADDAAEDLAEQLVDVAETAAAADHVDQAIADVATELQPPPDYDFAEAIAGMANRHLQPAGLALEVVEACAGCGCTNRRACVLEHPRSIGGGMHVRTCHWIATAPGQPPRCSKCGPTDEALAANPATIMGIPIHRDDTVPAGELHLRDDNGNTLMRITNIEDPNDTEVTAAQVGLLEEQLQPYAAAETMTAEREGDDETALEARARRREG